MNGRLLQRVLWGLVILALPGLGNAYEQLIAPTGTDAAERFGQAVAFADVNADGIADLIVGASEWDSQRGRVKVFLGSASGVLDDVADFTFQGEALGDFFGLGIANAGDLNDDGVDDIAIGSYHALGGDLQPRGRVYIYFGDASTPLASGMTLDGETEGDRFGNRVAGAGDVDGDGVDDLLVGAVAYAPVSAGFGTGAIYVFYGDAAAPLSTSTLVTGEVAGDSFGVSVDGAGDVDGDGFDDIVVGAHGYDGPGGGSSGRGYVFFGDSTTPLANSFTINGEVASDGLGIVVSGAGDLNGDGYGDVAFSSYSHDSGGLNDAGRVYVRYGDATTPLTSGTTLSGTAAFEYFGFHIDGSDDLDYDGVDDLVVGATGGLSKTHVYLGSASGTPLSTRVTIDAPASGEKFGYSVGVGGDFNGDSVADLAVGAIFADPGGIVDAGIAYVFSVFESATLAPTPAASGPINCSQSSPVALSYAPPSSGQGLRGYSIRITADPQVSFLPADILVHAVPSGVNHHSEIITNGANDYTVDYTILGTAPGTTVAADLFTVTCHGEATGQASFSIVSAELKDDLNVPIPAVHGAVATIDVDCTPPTVPVMAAEETYTQGTGNTVDWSDESGSGAALYYAERAEDAGFSAGLVNSGWVAAISESHSTLTDGQIYYYRVKAKDALDNESGWSNVEFSTQDATAPVSSADALAAYHNTTSVSIAYTASDATSGVASVELFYSYDGSPYVSAGTFGASPAAFTAGADGHYEFYTRATDGVGLVEAVPGSPPDASTIVDTTAPAAGTFAIDGGAVVTASLSVNLDSDGITDVNPPLEMRFSNDAGTTWPEGWVAYAADHSWTLASGADGTRTVHAEYRDAALNVLPLNDSINYDTAPPAAAADIAAIPGHNKVVLNWSHDGLDTVEYEIYRGLWYDTTPGNSAYPEYDDLANDAEPTRPADRAAAESSVEWTPAGTAPAGTVTFTDTWPDATSRGVYYYEVFARDAAGNYSAVAAANDRSTNYWLGDVDPGQDGLVDMGDITVLATSYGLLHGASGYNAFVDVGPTDDFSGSGVPMTDNYVGFDDLMIFGINYGEVGPAPLVQPEDCSAQFAWMRIGENRWALHLLEECSSLKGLHLTLAVSMAVAIELEAGALLAEQSVPVFLRNASADGIDLGLAVLGHGQGIAGAGELFSVTLPAGIELETPVLTARDIANGEMTVQLDMITEAPDMPTAFALSLNYPNPFNPTTVIRYELPEAREVKLQVFAIDGRLVSKLVDASMPAGRHEAVWHGRDDAGRPVPTGVYFYRLDAGSFCQTERMLLLK